MCPHAERTAWVPCAKCIIAVFATKVFVATNRICTIALLPRRDFLLSVQARIKAHTAVSQKYRLGEFSKDVFCIGGMPVGETREEGGKIKIKSFRPKLYLSQFYNTQNKRIYARKHIFYAIF